jgi:hypothetical protein
VFHCISPINHIYYVYFLFHSSSIIYLFIIYLCIQVFNFWSAHTFLPALICMYAHNPIISLFCLPPVNPTFNLSISSPVRTATSEKRLQSQPRHRQTREKLSVVICLDACIRVLFWSCITAQMKLHFQPKWSYSVTPNSLNLLLTPTWVCDKLSSNHDSTIPAYLCMKMFTAI